MKPRPYRLGQRETAALQTRTRILSAARALLAGPKAASFTIDAVAAQAGVGRTTVFNQFGSKRELLEALFDDLAARGLVENLKASFRLPDPHQAFDALIAAFLGFWSSERIVLRRIRGLAALDPVFEAAVGQREEWRREGLQSALSRLSNKRRGSTVSVEEVVDVLHTLTSFETFDGLATANRDMDSVMTVVRRLAWTEIGN